MATLAMTSPDPPPLTDGSLSRAAAPSMTARRAVVAAAFMWDPATRAFDGPRLHRAIVVRGWTVREFARAARLHVASVYNALQGKPVRDSTAIRIFELLEKRQPMLGGVQAV